MFGKSSKTDYEATAEAKMQKLGAQIDELQAKADVAKADANWSKLLDEPIVFTKEERRWVLDYVEQQEAKASTIVE